mmetsp:Transcript_81478/g.174531  ORF Transcript_81478/g.174531 Transcript_81478/m.174531 type:complete len:192 (-) Transcript_81478:127-702(-)
MVVSGQPAVPLPALPPPPFLPNPQQLSAFAEYAAATAPPGQRSRLLAVSKASAPGRSASEGRLRAEHRSSGSSKGRGPSGTPARSQSGALAGGRTKGEDDVWRIMAPFGKRDHVACLLSQPLPTKGDKLIEAPAMPTHIKACQSLMTASFTSMPKATLHNQRFQEHWHGLQRNINSDYDAQAVTQAHIMRK